MNRDCFWLTEDQFFGLPHLCRPIREASLGSMNAYAFLPHRRLIKVGAEKGPPPQPGRPALRHAIVNLLLRPPPSD